MHALRKYMQFKIISKPVRAELLGLGQRYVLDWLLSLETKLGSSIAMCLC